jgi:hypothetical protein
VCFPQAVLRLRTPVTFLDFFSFSSATPSMRC